MNFSSSSAGAGEATAGEVGSGEGVHVLPAREEAFPAELASQMSTCTQSSNFRDSRVTLCSL